MTVSRPFSDAPLPESVSGWPGPGSSAGSSSAVMCCALDRTFLPTPYGVGIGSGAGATPPRTGPTPLGSAPGAAGSRRGSPWCPWSNLCAVLACSRSFARARLRSPPAGAGGSSGFGGRDGRTAAVLPDISSVEPFLRFQSCRRAQPANTRRPAPQTTLRDESGPLCVHWSSSRLPMKLISSALGFHPRFTPSAPATPSARRSSPGRTTSTFRGPLSRSR